jgi:hypothetical protein
MMGRTRTPLRNVLNATCHSLILIEPFEIWLLSLKLIQVIVSGNEGL